MATSLGISCPVCGGLLEPAFDGRILNRYAVKYHRCASCRSLALPEPKWLDEAYSKKFHPDPDSGSLRRSLFTHRLIVRMHGLGILPAHHRSLDFGCGKGELVRLLLDDGQDAYGLDAYPAPVYGEERVSAHWPLGQFQLITAIEVVEHLADPSAVFAAISKRLAPEGLVLLSTALYDEHRHGADWGYLAQEFGQHITLFSRAGLVRLAARHHLTYLGSIKWLGEELFHLFVQDVTRFNSTSFQTLLAMTQSEEKS